MPDDVLGDLATPGAQSLQLVDGPHCLTIANSSNNSLAPVMKLDGGFVKQVDLFCGCLRFSPPSVAEVLVEAQGDPHGVPVPVGAVEAEALQAVEEVVEGEEVDDGVDGVQQALPAVPVLAVDDLVRAVQRADDEGDVPVVHLVAEGEEVLAPVDGGLRDPDLWDDAADGVRDVEVGGLGAEARGAAVRVRLQVPEERRGEVDLAVRRAVEARGHPGAAGGRERPPVHDHVGLLDAAVDVREHVGHGCGARTGRVGAPVWDALPSVVRIYLWKLSRCI